jgi:hypothetical protein
LKAGSASCLFCPALLDLELDVVAREPALPVVLLLGGSERNVYEALSGDLLRCLQSLSAASLSECSESCCFSLVLLGEKGEYTARPPALPSVQRFVECARRFREILTVFLSEAAVYRMRPVGPSDAVARSVARGLPVVSSEEVAGSTGAGSRDLVSSSAFVQVWS